MSYLGANVPGGAEAWEKEYGQFISEGLARLSHFQRMAILMSVGIITAIEISNRISINVILPDMEGNVAASSDTISWVLILYNLGFLCSLALTAWLTRVFGARRHGLRRRCLPGTHRDSCRADVPGQVADLRGDMALLLAICVSD